MDGFILDATIDQNVKPKDYGFSSELKKITKTTKEIETKNDANMSSLIKAIRGNLEIEAIQSTLVYLKENTYSSKESDLRKLFANAIAFSQNKVLGEDNIRMRGGVKIWLAYAKFFPQKTYFIREGTKDDFTYKFQKSCQ